MLNRRLADEASDDSRGLSLRQDEQSGSRTLNTLGVWTSRPVWGYNSTCRGEDDREGETAGESRGRERIEFSRELSECEERHRDANHAGTSRIVSPDRGIVRPSYRCSTMLKSCHPAGGLDPRPPRPRCAFNLRPEVLTRSPVLPGPRANKRKAALRAHYAKLLNHEWLFKALGLNKLVDSSLYQSRNFPLPRYDISRLMWPRELFFRDVTSKFWNLNENIAFLARGKFGRFVRHASTIWLFFSLLFLWDISPPPLLFRWNSRRSRRK